MYIGGSVGSLKARRGKTNTITLFYKQLGLLQKSLPVFKCLTLPAAKGSDITIYFQKAKERRPEVEFDGRTKDSFL